MKEKKVSQSTTKIRIISCTAASCAPFRPRCTHSCRPCAPPTRLLVTLFPQDRAPFRPPSTRSHRRGAPPTRLLVAPFPQRLRPFGRCPLAPATDAHPQRVSSSCHFPKVARPSAKVGAKSPRIFAFSSPLSEKSPLVLEKSPHVFLRAAPTGSPSAAVAQRKNFTSSGESAQKCARVHFFLLLVAFILKKTRYICNENPFYHLCVAKHRDLSSARCVRRTAYKLPHLARL